MCACDKNYIIIIILTYVGGGLRLVSSTSRFSSSGRVEVFNNGQFGTVCETFFDQTDANVACRQLGYANATNYGTVGSLG